MKKVLHLIREVFSARNIIWTMALNDFKSRYIGSYFGLAWAVVQSVITFLLYWVVFQYFLGAPSKQSVPFPLWLMAGLVPWMFFSDALINVTGTFQSYSYIVKKMTFKISILPLVKILSSFFMSIFLNLILIATYLIANKLSLIHLLDILYYNICMFYLLTGISFALSSINVFFRDLSQIISIVVQFGTWVTPILWDYKTMGHLNSSLVWLLKINPMFYITEGYRSALIDHVWFFGSFNQMILFWVVSTLLFFLGAYTYAKLRPHFADVL